MKAILYSTGCPKCKVLKSKLDSKNIDYEIESDIDKMLRLGMVSIPYLQIGDKIMDFKESVDYLNSMD